MKKLNSDAGFESWVLYPVFFTAPEDIVQGLYARLKNAAWTKGSLFVGGLAPQNGLITVRLTGLQQDTVAKAKQTFQSSFQAYHPMSNKEERLPSDHPEMWMRDFLLPKE